MSHRSIFCVAPACQQAQSIVDHLKAATFSEKTISVVWSSKRAPAAGLKGLECIIIPGLEPLLAAGPIVAALSRRTPESSSKDFQRIFTELGLSRDESALYQEKFDRGAVIISVHIDNANAIYIARAIFAESGAGDICTTGESGAATLATTLPSAGSLMRLSLGGEMVAP